MININHPRSFTSRFDFFKEVVDKQNITFLKTPEGINFIKSNVCINGSYSTRDKFNNNKSNHGYSRDTKSIYCDPTISIYAVIMEKPIFLKSLLQAQFELELQKEHPDILKNIIYQGIFQKKVDILNLSIKSHSDRCFDVILDFIKEVNINEQIISIDFGMPTALYTAIMYDNDHALNSLLETKPSPIIYESKGEYDSPFMLSIKKFNKISISFYMKYIENDPKKIEKLKKIKYKQGNLLDFIETTEFFSEIKDYNVMVRSSLIKDHATSEFISILMNNDDDSDKDISNSSTLTRDIQSQENDPQLSKDVNHINKCSYEGCNNSSHLMVCNLCNKYFCDEHLVSHACSF